MRSSVSILQRVSFYSAHQTLERRSVRVLSQTDDIRAPPGVMYCRSVVSQDRRYDESSYNRKAYQIYAINDTTSTLRGRPSYGKNHLKFLNAWQARPDAINNEVRSSPALTCLIQYMTHEHTPVCFDATAQCIAPIASSTVMPVWCIVSYSSAMTLENLYSPAQAEAMLAKK